MPGMEYLNVDGMVNLLTGLGVSGLDKRLNAVTGTPATLGQQELEDLYRGDDIVARLCNLPSNAMVNKWFQVKTSDVDDRENVEAMIQELKRLNAKKVARLALIWSQLYGGSVIIMGIDDGREMFEPLNEKGIKSIDYLTVLDRHALEIVSFYNAPGQPEHRMPETYRITQTAQPSAGAAGVNAGTAPVPVSIGEDAIIHESRLIRFDGAITPENIKLANQGWCDSVVTRVYEVVRDYSSAYGGAFLLVQDVGVAAYKLKGLSNNLKHDKDGRILSRLQLMHVAKSVARAIPLDADGESLEYPKQQIQGLEKLLEKFDIRLSMAVGWPATVLLGQSPKGLNATGESDLTNWYDHIEAEQERNLLEQMTKLVGILFKVLKKEPKTWSVSFSPLWQASAKDVAEERKAYAEADGINIDRGIYTPDEASNSRYGGDEFGTEISLDRALRETDKIPSADPADVPDLRPEPEAEDDPIPSTELMGVIKAFNSGELSREQAIAVLVTSFQLAPQEAATIVGPEKDEPPAPAVPPTPPPPGAPEPPDPNPDPEE